MLLLPLSNAAFSLDYNYSQCPDVIPATFVFDFFVTTDMEVISLYLESQVFNGTVFFLLKIFI
jgi:hypothetical protein